MANYYIYIDQPKKLKKIVEGLRKLVRDATLAQSGQELADYYQEEYIDPLVDKLKKYPRTRDRSKKVDWASEDQKKYMMWMWRKNRIKLPHRRTKKLQKGWEGEVTYDDQEQQISIEIKNTNPRSQYVVGKVGFSKAISDIKKYEKPIQPFHKKLWKPAHAVIQPVVEKIRQDIIEKGSEKTSKMFNLFDKA